VPIAALILVVVGCSSSPPGVRVTDARIPQPPSGDVAVVYMTIHNTSGDSDTLESASSSASSSASVHKTVRKGLVEEMLPDGPVEIAGGADFTLRTGGSHLMLEHLRNALRIGDTVTVTLHFDRAGTVKVRAPVVSSTAATTG
jgi:copper(I)-binding protein